MQTKFNIGDKVYYVRDGYPDIRIDNIKSIYIEDKGKIKYKSSYHNRIHEENCFASFNEAKQELIKKVTKKYQDDMATIMNLEEKA